ncbi:MAG: linearmycin/streptolysin transport system ATP-binding protein [Candidatus Binataceae bacterium]|nr:linearmycin/streptolysin transport system ATP-binding protein [Candidatus Binataceae bacterium]
MLEDSVSACVDSTGEGVDPLYSESAARAQGGLSPSIDRSGNIVLVPHGSPLLEAVGLRKSYGSRLVLDGVSIAVNAGEIVGLLGPNGAGKTTTLSLLATLLEPDAGTVRINGATPSPRHYALRRRLGFVPQAIALYPSLSAFQNLELFSRLHGVSKSQARSDSMRVLQEVGLADRSDDPVAVLSGGMKRRLNLACGMVHGPDLLLLDEPTVGVDPQSREQILDTVRHAAEAGAAIVYSTHYMEEVERICSRALLIDNGKVVAAGTITELIALGGRQTLMEITFRHSAPPNWCAGLTGITPIPGGSNNGKVALQLESFALVDPILERARIAGAQVLEFSVHSANLSDAFIALTGHALRDPARDAH